MASCCARRTRWCRRMWNTASRRMGVEVARQVEGLADWIEGNLGRILSGRRERADALAASPLPGVRAGVRTSA